MEPLLIGGDEYERSVAFDGTKAGGTQVTVGVEATREQEAQLLDICCDEQGDQFRPFATKSDNLDLNEVPVGELIERFPGRVAVGLCSGAPNQFIQAEAAHSAVLYSKLDPVESTTAVIADGDEIHAERLGEALWSLEAGRVPAVPCHKSEFYYPQSYLADLLAGAIAGDYDITNSEVQEACEVWTEASDDGDPFWKAYNAVRAGEYSYRLPDREEKIAQKPSTRARVWFGGSFRSNAGSQLQTDSTRRVETWLERNGHTAAAERIS